MSKIEKSKEKLFYLYIEEKMTQKEIADIYGVHEKTVGKWLRSYGVKKSRKEITKEIQDRYYQKFGVRTPAEREEVRDKIISTNIEKYGNPSSLHGENQDKTKKALLETIGVENPSYLRLNSEAREILLNKETFRDFLAKEDNTSSKIISSKLSISVATFNRYVKKYDLEYMVDRQQSKGAAYIKYLLEKNGLSFETEKTFPACRGLNNPLPFDFYVESHNLLIEFDGRQHFEPIEYWGGEEGFKTRQFYDSLKNSFAKENGFKLLRFNYLQSEEAIEREFKKKCEDIVHSMSKGMG